MDARHSAAAPGGDDRWLDAAARVARLGELLEQEFAALRERELDTFEGLQGEKNDSLTWLSALADEVAQQPTPPAGWLALRESLAACRDAHQRNARLLEKMLEAVRGTLNALHGDGAPSVDLYDRMGRMARRLGAFGVHIA